MGLRITAVSGDDVHPAPHPDPVYGLKDLIWILGPVSPGSEITTPRPTWKLAAAHDELCLVPFSVGNHQAAAAYLTLTVTPLAGPGSIIWRPELSTGPARLLVLPGRFMPGELAFRIPGDLAPGTYRGALTALEMSGVLPRIELLVRSGSR